MLCSRSAQEYLLHKEGEGPMSIAALTTFASGSSPAGSMELRAELDREHVPIFDIGECRQCMRKKLAELRPGPWQVFWPLARLLVWTANLCSDHARRFCIITAAMLAALAGGIYLWLWGSDPLAPVGMILVTVGAVVLLVFTATIVLMLIQRPWVDNLLDAGSLWETFPLRAGRYIPPHHQQRLATVRAISGARLTTVELLNTVVFVRISRGDESYIIATWKTRDKKLDNL